KRILVHIQLLTRPKTILDVLREQAVTYFLLERIEQDKFSIRDLILRVRVASYLLFKVLRMTLGRDDSNRHTYTFERYSVPIRSCERAACLRSVNHAYPLQIASLICGTGISSAAANTVRDNRNSVVVVPKIRRMLAERVVEILIRLRRLQYRSNVLVKQALVEHLDHVRELIAGHNPHDFGSIVAHGDPAIER